MDGYSNKNYADVYDDSEEEEDTLKKSKIKYSLLREEDFEDEDDDYS